MTDYGTVRYASGRRTDYATLQEAEKGAKDFSMEYGTAYIYTVEEDGYRFIKAVYIDGVRYIPDKQQEAK